MLSPLNVNLPDSTIHGSSVLSPAPSIPRLPLPGSPVLVGSILSLASRHLLCVYDQSLPRDLGGACSVTCTQLERKSTIAEWIDAYLIGHPEEGLCPLRQSSEAPLSSRHMKSNMLFTLLVLCVGLAPDTEAQKPDPFDPNQYKSFWYEIAFASTIDDQDSENNEKLGALKDSLERHLLNVITKYYNNKRCMLEKVPALEEDSPGKFRVTRSIGKDAVPGLQLGEASVVGSDALLLPSHAALSCREVIPGPEGDSNQGRLWDQAVDSNQRGLWEQAEDRNHEGSLGYQTTDSTQGRLGDQAADSN
ncbi:uncharacterized protein LOC119819724 [Arvicola amphibius]|uniref:uncharacterized protein LOC119819724 n=1 Tax=Arvicola amphibius TaxID=1047088 RepID=UPI001C097A40|nr:uncharacterized protein LOC119819724 [Arvicola amphibius]